MVGDAGSGKGKCEAGLRKTLSCRSCNLASLCLAEVESLKVENRRQPRRSPRGNLGQGFGGRRCLLSTSPPPTFVCFGESKCDNTVYTARMFKLSRAHNVNSSSSPVVEAVLWR